MKPIKSHKFRSGVWRIADSKKMCKGECEEPGVKYKEMRVPLSGYDCLNTLDTIVHESIHACLWDLDENCVGETANAISSFLWRIGYRKT